MKGVKEEEKLLFASVLSETEEAAWRAYTALFMCFPFERRADKEMNFYLNEICP